MKTAFEKLNHRNTAWHGRCVSSAALNNFYKLSVYLTHSSNDSGYFVSSWNCD